MRCVHRRAVKLDAAELAALELGLEVNRLPDPRLRKADAAAGGALSSALSGLSPRRAVVAVLGHVDHGA